MLYKSDAMPGGARRPAPHIGGGTARVAAYGNERVIAHLFLPKNTPPPYSVVAIMGGSTIADGIKRVEDFDYPYEFLVRSGRAVIIPAYSGTLERGPSDDDLPAVQERERSLRWSMDLGRTIDYLRPGRHRIAEAGLRRNSGAYHGVDWWPSTVDSRLRCFHPVDCLQVSRRRSTRGTSPPGSTFPC